MNDTGSAHPSHEREPHKTWTLALASLGLFMVALDTLVVTTALPVLRVDLGASLSDLEWPVNVYNLAFACFLLTGAALGDRFGRRRMFAFVLLLFTASSAAAALSPSVDALIAARAVQGAGAAIVMPLTLTLISEAFPAEKRGGQSVSGAVSPDSPSPLDRSAAAASSTGSTGTGSSGSTCRSGWPWSRSPSAT